MRMLFLHGRQISENQLSGYLYASVPLFLPLHILKPVILIIIKIWSVFIHVSFHQICMFYPNLLSSCLFSRGTLEHNKRPLNIFMKSVYGGEALDRILASLVGIQRTFQLFRASRAVEFLH